MSNRSLDSAKPLTIAVFALGGQGGGVLVDWIVALAERCGYHAQATSVPGVAQRTGATVYYVEMIDAKRSGDAAPPIFALMPSPGDVDIVLCAELVEAGRAMQRGFVTPSRTTLISSTHRAYAIVEKAAAGDGIVAGDKILQAAHASARRLIAFDMGALAQDAGSVISAVMFGALAASGGCPFPRQEYEATIRKGGIGVEASLMAFAKGLAAAEAGSGKHASTSTAQRAALQPHDKKRFSLDPTGHVDVDDLMARARDRFPSEVHGRLAAGLLRTIDFQDIAYGRDYLDLVATFLALDEAHGSAKAFALTNEAAKYVAVAMAYDDVIRVADLKTRASRFARVRAEVKARAEDVVAITEFLHPRVAELCGLLPNKLGSMVEASPRLCRLMGLLARGRQLRTDTASGFIQLYALAALRRWRRGTLRHHREWKGISSWVGSAASLAVKNYDLAVEVLRCRRLVKGYSDTHARGQSKFHRVMAAAKRLQDRPDAADWVRRLTTAALADEPGSALDQALATIDTFM